MKNYLNNLISFNAIVFVSFSVAYFLLKWLELGLLDFGFFYYVIVISNLGAMIIQSIRNETTN